MRTYHGAVQSERERLSVSESVNIAVFGSQFSSVNDSALNLNILYYLLFNTIIVPKEAFISNLRCGT